ncbi:hypothetical protein phiPccP1_00014 [Pectobacterium phage phiPccP-1]|nr:hypothetical protein phiPccP1_00014 [Pectobacterium phage phiPccP-1]
MSKLHGLKMKHWRKFLIVTNESGAHPSDYCSELGLKGSCGGIPCNKCPMTTPAFACRNLHQIRTEYINHVTKEAGL